jgi:hypothetical protein
LPLLVGYLIDSRTDCSVFAERHPAHRVEFPRLGFAFLGHCEMVMFLISGILPDLVIGLKGENGVNFCCIFSPVAEITRFL